MSLPIQLLTQSQRHWYAQMVIAAVLADNEISQPETEFIKQIAQLVKDTTHKREILTRIAKRNPPSVYKPAGIYKEVLAAVFMELSLILISDIDFATEEREFLENVYKAFGFTEDYYHKLLGWCEDGLAWKSEQMKLAQAEGKNASAKVPVDDLSPEQQQWYAETLIATIMSDEALDKAEVSFLKTAIALIQDSRQRQELTNQIRKGKPPVLSQPQQISNDILIRIYIEVLLIISADESLNPKEEAFLEELADLCGFSNELFQRLMNWCREGIRWKQSKNELISACEIKQEKKGLGLKIFKGEKREKGGFKVFSRDGEASGRDYAFRNDEASKEVSSSQIEQVSQESRAEPDPIEEAEEINSLEIFDLDCFICGGNKSVRFFQLKPKSQKPNHNIFGIPVYLVSKEGYDYVDYNLCKVAICSACFFASTQKNMFRAKSEAALPQPLQDPRFTERWLKDQTDRLSVFKHQKSEIVKARRSLSAAVKSYQMAISASSALAEINKSSELEWHSITLKLTLAEVLMNHGKSEKAENLLKQISAQSEEIFRKAKSKFIAFRSGRVILLIALYFGELRKAAAFHDYFQNVKNEEFKKLNDGDKTLFKRIFGEVDRAFENQRAYMRESLRGFHLD